MIRLLVNLVLILPAMLACTAPAPQTSSRFGGPISVVDVIDGDTIRIAGRPGAPDLSARLVGYDAPETSDPGCAQELALGQAATQRLQVLLHGAGRIDSIAMGTDRYDRQLLKLVLDGRDLAGIMISEGLAVPYDGGRRINWCQKLAAT